MARQERAIRTRHTIVEASAEVFDEVGYEAATISEILKRSGVTKGALYFHFTSKEELAQEVLASQLAAVPEVPKSDLTLQQIVDESLLLSHMLQTGDALVRGSIRLTVEQGSLADGLDRRIPMQAWIDHGVVLFSKAKAEGELLPHVDVDAVAKMFVGGFTGIQILSNILCRHADITERMADLHRTLMTAIAVPGVLVRLDFLPERAARVYEAAMEQRRERKGTEASAADN